MNQNLYDLSFCYCTKHVHHIHGPFHCFHVSDPSFTGSISALLKTRLSLMDPSTVAIQVIQHIPDFFAAQRHVFSGKELTRLTSTQTPFGCLELLCRYHFPNTPFGKFNHLMFYLFLIYAGICEFKRNPLLNLHFPHQRGSLALADGDPLTPNWPSLDNAYR